MPRATMTFAETDMDWGPLQSIVGQADLGNWMWMHRDTSPETGAVVHFYKHVWSRRYLRLDHRGRVYRELDSGAPVPLPGCGGGMLIALLALASAAFEPGLPRAITLPEAARERVERDDLRMLAAVFQRAADDFFEAGEARAGHRTARIDEGGGR